MSIILDKTNQQMESHETQKVLYSKKKKKKVNWMKRQPTKGKKIFASYIPKVLFRIYK